MSGGLAMDLASEDPPARPRADAVPSDLAADDHVVHFYEADDRLCAFVAEFLAAGLAGGERALVIATAPHRLALGDALRAAGFELDRLGQTGQLVQLDADETLSGFMVDGEPDQARFEATVRTALVAPGGETGGAGRVRAYGEMVDLLWRRGNPTAAIRLEEMWNDVQKATSLCLLCSYGLAGFYTESTGVEQVARVHSHVHVAAAPAPGEGAPARTLALAMAQRKLVERALSRSLTDLRREEQQRRESLARAERLTQITSAIADAVTTEQVFCALVDRVGEVLGASSAALWLVRPGQPIAELVRAGGYPEGARQRLLTLSLEGAISSPAVDCLRRGQPVWLDSQDELLRAYPELSSVATAGRSYRIACLPVVAHGQTLGALCMTFDDAPPLGDEGRTFLLLVARYSGQALERLRLLDAERAIRTQSEAAAARLAVLSRASRAFSEADRDLAGLLTTIAEEATRDYADGCAILLTQDGGDRMDLAASHHRDAAAAAALRQLLAAVSPRVGEGITGRVVQTGQSFFEPAVDADAVVTLVQPEFRDWVRRYLPQSLMVVPLRAHGKVIGALAVERQRGSRPFDASDLQLLEDLAERAALAIENCRLHRDHARGLVRAELLFGLARAVIGAKRVDDVFVAALDAIERAFETRRASILVFDRDGVMRFRAWRGLSDAYRQAVEGHSPWSRETREPAPLIIPDALGEPAMAPYHALFREERIGALGFIPLVADGQLIGKFMVYYDEPRQLAAPELGLAMAIADHVAAAISRFSAVGELERTVKFNELFAGILGHDLRNPLAAIVTSARLMMLRDGGERLLKPLSRILSSGDRMTRMIDQLLDFTRVRVGNGIPVLPRPIDVVPVIRQVMGELEDANPDCTLRLEHLGATDGTWDADRLAQVFSNLIGNAVLHGRRNGAVDVHVDGNDPAVVLVSVRNAGAIPPHLLPDIFEPLAGGERRLHASRGLGLGLHISREVVRAHGGRVTVQSDELAGTLFQVELPRAAPQRQ